MKKLNYFIFVLFALASLTACEKETELSREQEEKRLTELYTEIESLAKSSTCVNGTGLNYKAVGSKACGGPTGYIVYSSTIDTEKLIKLIDTYTELQRKFNEKYGIISTCDVISQPKSISCQDGKPVAIY